MPGRTPERDLSKRLQEARNEIEWLVKDAPPVSLEVKSRIWERVANEISEPPSQAIRPRSGRWPLGVRVAAVVVLLMGISGAFLSETALGRDYLWPVLMRFLPGSGFVTHDSDVRTLATPVTVMDGDRQVTVLGVVADSIRTDVRIQFRGWSEAVADFGETTLLVSDSGAQRPDWYVLRSTQEDTATLILSFPPLPTGREQVQIRLPAMGAVVDPVVLTLPLLTTRTETAGRSELPEVVRSIDGVELRLHAVFVQEDGVYLPIALHTSDPGRPVLGIETRPDRSPYLRDDRGFPYSLDRERSESVQQGERPLTLVFTPGLRDGAESLHLVVPSLLIEETGRADFSTPVSHLASGDRVRVDQTLHFGRLTIQVTELERLDQRRFRLHLEQQPNPGANSTQRWVGFRRILLHEGTVSATVVNHVVDGVTATYVDLDTPELVEALAVRFENPVLSRIGPWELEVPLNGE